VTPQASPLLEEDPYLDLLFSYDKKGEETLWGVVRKVRRMHFDILVSPHRSHRSSILALASRIPHRVGFRDAAFPWAYHTRVARPLSLHEVDRNLSLLRGLGQEPIEGDRILHVGYTEEEAKLVAEVLASEGVPSTERLVGLCPGSIWPTKRWPSEYFGEVGRALLGQGLHPVVLGGPGDVEVGRRVCDTIGEGATLAAGKTPLKALAAWMDRLSLLVTNDSAPLHVAAARGTPTVAVFGATTPALGFYPFHSPSLVAEVEVSCRPCGPHGGKRCSKGHFRCMTELTPGQVTAMCLQVLGGRA
jgi:heptosyltransferase-2